VAKPSSSNLFKGLEALYAKYNKRKFVHPDPLEFLYLFPDPREREVAGLICACLAYGRVAQILKKISQCLEKMEMRPRRFLLSQDKTEIKRRFADFHYRFTKAPDMIAFLTGLKALLERYGSIEEAFANPAQDLSTTKMPLIVERLSAFVREFLDLAQLDKSYLLPDPQKKSACKRLFLYLRWMVRKDEVDPGGWSCVKPCDLLVPLDTHMFNIAKSIGFTKKKQAGLNCAIEITEAFKQINPEDPVKYDFVLTRFGIRSELSREDVPRLCLEGDEA